MKSDIGALEGEYENFRNDGVVVRNRTQENGFSTTLHPSGIVPELTFGDFVSRTIDVVESTGGSPYGIEVKSGWRVVASASYPSGRS